MPYYKRIGGSHYRRENGKMVRYSPGEILWAEEWELASFKGKVFEMVSLDAGRNAMMRRGLDPAEVESRVPEGLALPRRVVETPPPSPPPPEPKQEEVGLRLVHRGGGKYNVVNLATGEPINDTLLTKAEATLLIAGIEGGKAGEDAKENLKASESEPVDSAEDLAGQDSVPVRRRTKPAGESGGESEGEESE